jgi:hypothetical protein
MLRGVKERSGKRGRGCAVLCCAVLCRDDRCLDEAKHRVAGPLIGGGVLEQLAATQVWGTGG